jgi:hypothetical protein
MSVVVHGTTRVLEVALEGPPVSTGQDALDLVGDAWGHDATWVALPVGRLDPAYFDLRSGLAGELAQRFQNCGVRLAVVGDLGAHTEASDAFRDLVREAGRGRGSVVFVPDEAALRALVAAGGA